MASGELNFHQLKILLAVADCGSFSRAAEELFISQPAVSVQVKQLERALGVELLDRSGGKLRLTDDGQIVCEYARRIFALADEMQSALCEIDGLMSGRLTIGASTTVGEYLLPRLMGRFKERHPGITLGLEIANTQAVIARILDRRLHLGLVGDAVRSESLEVLPYRSDEIVVIASLEHRLARQSRVSVAEIANEGFIVREAGSATRRVAEATLKRLGIEMKVVMELGSNEAVKQAVAANLGIGMISRYAIDAELAARRLRTLDVEGCRCQRQLSIVYLRGKRLTRAEQAFLEMIREG